MVKPHGRGSKEALSGLALAINVYARGVVNTELWENVLVIHEEGEGG